jgi:hypothetical protein
MKNNLLQNVWMVFLFSFLISLLIWGIWYVPLEDNQIKVFGIVALILAAFTSVLTVSINNRKAKEREYEFHVLKEKQKVYEHFYNTLFESFQQIKNNKQGLSNKAITEMMLFKKGLMNWGSENLINKYLEYDSKLAQENQETFDLIKDGDIFLKEIRKEMGFKDSSELSLMSIMLTAKARKELIASNQ